VLQREVVRDDGPFLKAPVEPLWEPIAATTQGITVLQSLITQFCLDLSNLAGLEVIVTQHVLVVVQGSTTSVLRGSDEKERSPGFTTGQCCILGFQPSYSTSEYVPARPEMLCCKDGRFGITYCPGHTVKVKFSQRS